MWEAVRLLDYQPDDGARSLRRSDGRSRAVAAVLEDLANPFCAEILRGFEDVVRESGMLVLAGSVDDDATREQDLVRAFTNRRADGMLLMSVNADHQYLRKVTRERIPIVFVDRPPVGYDADCVLVDNLHASEEAVAHLAAHGHRRIAYLGERPTRSTGVQRYEGFRNAIARLGVSVPPAYAAQDLRTPQAVDAALTRMLDLGEPPTAIFSSQNDVTIAALHTLQRRGLASQVAIVGFDDFPLADLMQPGITVIAQDPAAIGRAGAELLLSRLDGSTEPALTRVVPTRLIVRGSGEIAPASTAGNLDPM